ncbi:MAG: ABC transporter ATP-binding protein [Acidimicrobiales bacterium]
MARLDCSGLSVRADGRVLLDRVDLTIEDATACVVMGPSGAGKSTLLRAVAGLVEHTGTVRLDGSDLAGMPPHRRGVGLLFQRPRLFPTMSVIDNVAYPLRVRRIRRADRRRQAGELLGEVGLADRADATPEQLSGGEQQRVALARALCSDPGLLMLDEPLTGLDLPQRRDLVRLLARLRRDRNLTWLVVTHDPDDAAALADTIAIIDRGRLVQHDTVDTVEARPASRLAAAVTANPNLLRGEIHDGQLHLGVLRLPVAGPAGSAVFTLPGSRIRLGPGYDGMVRLAMRSVALERRGPGRVVRLESDAGTLEAPWPHASSPSPALEVWFDPADLWRLDEPAAPITTADKRSAST